MGLCNSLTRKSQIFVTAVDEDHYHLCRWHPGLSPPCVGTVQPRMHSSLRLTCCCCCCRVTNSDWKQQDSVAQGTQGTNKQMDFLVALQLAEQFTLVKKVKYNKVRETAYPLYLVINKDDKVRWLVQSGHILFITENQGVSGTNCLGKASRTGGNKPFTQKQYFQAFPSVTMSKIVHWRQTFLLASSAFCDLCPPQSWIDTK